MQRRRKFSAGFTLIELLIAIGIFAIVSSIAYSGLNQVLRARDRIEAEREFWRTLSLVFLRMQDDFSQAAPRPIRNTLGTTDPAFVGQPTDIRALGAPSVEFTRGGNLEFDIKFDDEDDQHNTDVKPEPPHSDLERIGYRYSEGVLYRLTWPVLDRAPTTEPVQTELLSGVEKFEVKFFNPNATSTFNQWFPVWPQPAAGGAPSSFTELPLGVKVELKLKGHDEITRLFVISG